MFYQPRNEWNRIPHEPIILVITKSAKEMIENVRNKQGRKNGQPEAGARTDHRKSVMTIVSISNLEDTNIFLLKSFYEVPV